MTEIQTDLALELQEGIDRITDVPEGIAIDQKTEENGKIIITKIEIFNEEGSRRMCRPTGIYLTIESKEGIILQEKNSLSSIVERELIKLLPSDWKTLLVAGLGNADMTADALGPETIEKLNPSRILSENNTGMAAIATGVSDQTGMESLEILSGICQKIRPDAVIAIDALAAKSVFRLGNTFQITDSGILPGSGIGNGRVRIDRQSLGIPVIAIGVPMVVSAASIVCDAFSSMERIYKDRELLGMVGMLEETERKELVMEMMMPSVGELYVAPKDMDHLVRAASSLIAGVINHITTVRHA